MLVLGEKITLARKKAGLNKAQLARAIGVKPPTVTNWENGVVKMVSARNLFKLGKLFNVEPEWFLSNKKSTEPPKQLSHHEMLALLTKEDLDALVRVMQAMLDADQYRK